GLYVTISFLIALWRPNLIWNAPANLWLVVLLVSILYVIADALAAKVDWVAYETLLEVPAIAVALAGAVYIVNRSPGWSPDLLLPVGLALPGVWLYRRTRQAQTLASSVVAAAVLLLALLMSAGIANIGAALVFLALGICLLTWELRTSNIELPTSNFSYLRLVALGVATLAAIGLSFPWGVSGVVVLAALPVVYLVASTLARERRVLRIALEVTSYTLMLFTALVVAAQGMMLPAAILATVYACCFFFAMARHRQALYLYPAGVFAILAVFLFALIAGRGAWYVLLAFPLTLIFHGVAAQIKSTNLGDWRAKAVKPLYLGGHLDAALGAAAFVLLAPNLGDFAALAGATSNLILYAWLVYRRHEQTFLAGMGIAAALFALIVMSLLPFVQRANIIGYFAPVILVLLLAGWLLKRDKEEHASRAMLSAVTALTVVAGGVALWGEGLNQPSVWIALVISSVVWLSLLLLTRLDVFVYLITASLALLSFNFVRATGDLFTPHVFIFLVYGCVLLAAIFVYDLVSRHMRFRAPIHFGRPILRRDWVLAGIPAVVLAVIAFGAFGVESTSTPSFCNLCHTMNPYYANWQQSVHAQAGAGCADCHYAPTAQSFVRNKIVGISQVVKVATDTESYLPVAVVSDSSCLRGGCHAESLLQKTPIWIAAGVSFNHGAHLVQTLRGVQVTCTVCHTATRADEHFSVNQAACLLCHLKGTQVAANECVKCHVIANLPTKGGFSHGTLLANNKPPDCVACHAGVTLGDGKIKDECSACHIQDTKELLRTEPPTIHRIHVTDKGIRCDRCHTVIEHRAAQTVSAIAPTAKSSTAGTPPRTPANHAGRTQCLICHTTGVGGAPKAPTTYPDHSMFKDDNNAALCLMCHARE
ncbi:MAG: NapC/NirT family cytochrome c, partial [Chloroflexi bacterium]|nr:NapC/NirT family cytochrome c [Chloroflexota bacterium]